MIQAERDLWAKQFNISLAVEEEGTGVIQQQQRIIDLSKLHYEISFANYRDTFKFDDTRPYTTDVFIKRNDNGKPAAGKTVLVLVDYAKSDFADYFYKKGLIIDSSIFFFDFFQIKTTRLTRMVKLLFPSPPLKTRKSSPFAWKSPQTTKS